MIEDNKENEDHASERGRTAIIFSLKNEVGGLVKALKLFQVCMLSSFNHHSSSAFLNCKGSFWNTLELITSIY